MEIETKSAHVRAFFCSIFWLTCGLLPPRAPSCASHCVGGHGQIWRSWKATLRHTPASRVPRGAMAEIILCPGPIPKFWGVLNFGIFRGYFRVIRAHGPYLSGGNTQKYHMFIFLPKTTATWCAKANGEYQQKM